MKKQSNEINTDLEKNLKKVEKNLELDMNRLLKRLEKMKGIPLSERETYLLCLCFLGNQATDIAKEENKDSLKYENNQLRENYPDLTEKEIKKKLDEVIAQKAGYIRSEISNKLRKYLIKLIEKEDNVNTVEPDQIVRNWLKIICWLLENGYKKHSIQEQAETEVRAVVYLGHLKLKELNKLLEKSGTANFRLVIKEINQGDDEEDEQE